MTEYYEPDSSETKELLKVNIVDEMSEVLRAIDGKISPEIMEKLDWSIRAIQVRLSIAEGGISILEQSHLNHTNTDLAEFKNMHGPLPSGVIPGVSLKTPKSMYQLESDIYKCFRLTTELRDLILKFRAEEDEVGYYMVEAAVELLADAAGMEVSNR